MRRAVHPDTRRRPILLAPLSAARPPKAKDASNVRPSDLARDRHATARHAVAATTAALVFDDHELDRILDDADTRDLARLLAEWVAESLTHAAMHDCTLCPEPVLRHAGVRFAEDAA
jgi:hypothetical protein